MEHSSQFKSTTHKLSPIFKRHHTWRCLNSSDISYINRYKPKMFSRLSINSLCSENIGKNGIRNLCKALKDSKTLSSAHFDDPKANVKQLTYLFYSTNHWKNLDFLTTNEAAILDQELLKAISRLGRCKKLSTFPLSSRSEKLNANRETSNCFYQQLKPLRQLKNLGHMIPLENNPTIFNYRFPKFLTSLRLSFRSHVSQQQLSSFVTNLQRRCPYVDHLYLSFGLNYSIQFSDAEMWAKFFQNAPKTLQKLEIFMSIKTDQQSGGIQAFMGSLKHLKNLTSLRLSSQHPSILNPNPPFEENYFSLTFNSIQYLTQLEKLELEFRFFKSMRNFEVQSLNSMLQRLKNLKSFSTILPPLVSPDEGLMSISKALRQIPNLNDIDIQSFSNFSQKSLQILSKNIAQHKQLNSLRLYLSSVSYSKAPILVPVLVPAAPTIKQTIAKIFTFWKNDNNNLTSFFLDIRNFTQLSTLILQLSAVHDTPQEWKYLSLALQQLNKLSSFRLHLPQFNSDNDIQGLNELLSCFKDLPKLTQLDLHFEGNQVSNREIEILSSHLVGCQALSKLSLRFKNATQLKDESLYFLLSGIRGLLTLESITLLFEKKESFDGKAVDDFLEGLVLLKKLARFFLIYIPWSLYRERNSLLPPNLKSCENLRHLTRFVVGDSRYI